MSVFNWMYCYFQCFCFYTELMWVCVSVCLHTCVSVCVCLWVFFAKLIINHVSDPPVTSLCILLQYFYLFENLLIYSSIERYKGWRQDSRWELTALDILNRSLSLVVADMLMPPPSLRKFSYRFPRLSWSERWTSFANKYLLAVDTSTWNGWCNEEDRCCEWLLDAYPLQPAQSVPFLGFWPRLFNELLIWTTISLHATIDDRLVLCFDSCATDISR